ncbi:MAG TPA: DoxX family protein [Acidiferrobacterales bacterium]|nr:DoxX family protein [Acidiferrobacterales bacterium]
MHHIKKVTVLATPIINGLDFLSPVIDLFIRLWVANVFWKSGLTKIASWDATVALFTYEYHVPLLPPEIAATLGTAVELIFPVLLAFGLGARLSAAVLFVFNIIAVISYPDLSEVGLKDHIYWGILLLVPLLHGPGKLSIDHFIWQKWMAPG